MYCAALKLVDLAKFQNHQGFDGVMLGRPGMDYFEFTQCLEHPVAPTPTREDLLIFYAPDRVEWQSTYDRLAESGFVCVTSLNPYWGVLGKTFEGDDGYPSFCKTRRGPRDACVMHLDATSTAL
ncbi:hypothetical protein C8K18_13123 [Paraburkholderia sp. GV068]|nr:hypothetical protein C8K19_1306 [Paraburkholderia sp. GV072]PUA93646.1 hypothetical protein C8K18_13123 [Paraburkholderia sp. GV068]